MVLCGSRSMNQWLNPPHYSTLRTEAQYLEATLTGSPIDRLVLSLAIGCGLVILYRRRAAAAELFRNSKPLIAFTFYWAVTVLWSDIGEVSFKRWVRLLGNLVMAAILMTETDPFGAVRIVFRRAAYLLIPLSVVLIKYFPHIGILYIRKGEVLWIGVALMKNGLGLLSFVMALFLIWDTTSAWKHSAEKPRARLIFNIVVIAMSLWLLKGPGGNHSSAALSCLVVGVIILMALRTPMIKRRFHHLGILAVSITCVYLMLDATFGVTEFIVVDVLGRNMTFTDRVPLWNMLVDLGQKRPLLGYGYGAFWTPERVAQIDDNLTQSHNGYLDVFLEGGVLAIALLGILLLSVFNNIRKHGAVDYECAVLRLSFLATILLANVTESALANERDLLTFVFYVIALSYGIPYARALQTRLAA